jgi:fatty acid desaturase
MATVEHVSKEAEKKVRSFLQDKPVWVYWILFTVLIGVLFGISYILIYLLSLRWWVMALVIVVAGMAAGTFAYLGKENAKKSEASD